MRFVPTRNNADTVIANVIVGKKALPTLYFICPYRNHATRRLSQQSFSFEASILQKLSEFAVAAATRRLVCHRIGFFGLYFLALLFGLFRKALISFDLRLCFDWLGTSRLRREQGESSKTCLRQS